LHNKSYVLILATNGLGFVVGDFFSQTHLVTLPSAHCHGPAAFPIPRLGCQMVYFQTKNPNFGKFWSFLNWKMLIYFFNL
jgi:hypothetical protein